MLLYREHLKLFKAIEKLQKALTKGINCLEAAHKLGVHFFDSNCDGEQDAI